MSIYWVNALSTARLAIVARPRGNDWLEDDIKRLQSAGIDVLVSALTRDETEELGLSDEASCCGNCKIEFITLPIADRSVPGFDESFKNFLCRLKERIKQGKAVGVHCRASIGRSSLILACLLVQNKIDADEAFSCITASRGCPVPDTEEQKAWVRNHVKELKEL